MSDIVQSIRELPSWVKALVVVGVGLFVLIPILVVFAAVLGAFVLDLGSSAEMAQPPQVELQGEYDETAGELTISHEAGDPFDSGSVEIAVDGETRAWPDSGTVSQGDSVTLSGIDPGTTVRVVWTDPSGESMVLFRYRT